MFLHLDDGVQLHYESSGDATQPALLLWHGARCTLRQWDHVVRALEGSFHLIRFDVRGAGQSSGGTDESYTFANYAEDVCQLLNHLDVPRCHTWSMAWGSRAALAFCAAHPERVINAALFDLSIGTADVTAQMAGNKAARAKQRADGYEPPALPVDWNTHKDSDAVMKSLAAAGKVNLDELAPQLSMPILVATGDHDPNLASSRDAVQLMPNAQLVELKNVGHGSVLMQPDLCIRVFLEFVRQYA